MKLFSPKRRNLYEKEKKENENQLAVVPGEEAKFVYSVDEQSIEESSTSDITMDFVPEVSRDEIHTELESLVGDEVVLTEEDVLNEMTSEDDTKSFEFQDLFGLDTDEVEETYREDYFLSPALDIEESVESETIKVKDQQQESEFISSLEFEKTTKNITVLEDGYLETLIQDSEEPAEIYIDESEQPENFSVVDSLETIDSAKEKTTEDEIALEESYSFLDSYEFENTTENSENYLNETNSSESLDFKIPENVEVVENVTILGKEYFQTQSLKAEEPVENYIGEVEQQEEEFSTVESLEAENFKAEETAENEIALINEDYSYSDSHEFEYTTEDSENYLAETISSESLGFEVPENVEVVENVTILGAGYFEAFLFESEQVAGPEIAKNLDEESFQTQTIDLDENLNYVVESTDSVEEGLLTQPIELRETLETKTAESLKEEPLNTDMTPVSLEIEHLENPENETFEPTYPGETTDLEQENEELKTSIEARSEEKPVLQGKRKKRKELLVKFGEDQTTQVLHKIDLQNETVPASQAGDKTIVVDDVDELRLDIQKRIKQSKRILRRIEKSDREIIESRTKELTQNLETTVEESSVYSNVPDYIFDGGITLYNSLIRQMEQNGTLKVETLMSVLGALAGFSTQMAVREKMVNRMGIDEDQVFSVIETQNGERYFFSDTIDQLLQKDKHSIWYMAASATMRISGKIESSIEEIVRYSIRNLGKESFGVPRLTNQTRPPYLPEYFVENMWYGLQEGLERFTNDPLEWPQIFGIALQRSLVTTKSILDSNTSLRIALECAVPMSMIDLKPIKPEVLSQREMEDVMIKRLHNEIEVLRSTLYVAQEEDRESLLDELAQKTEQLYILIESKSERLKK